jgi:hypothetical protein
MTLIILFDFDLKEMKMLQSFSSLYWILTFAFSCNLLLAENNDIQDLFSRKLELNQDGPLANRKLWGVCADGSQPVIHYFEVLVRIQPSADITGACNLADEIKLGFDINNILSTHVSHSKNGTC